jgi:hypothetical protein
VAGRAGGGGRPQYIPRLHVTEEYIQLYSLVTRNREICCYIPLLLTNIGAYIHRSYIPQLLHRLTKEYNIYLSV